MENPYELLGVEKNAPPEQIRAAYRALVKRWHPDGKGDAAARIEGQEKLIQINLAYEEALSNVNPGHVVDAVHVAQRLAQQGHVEAALRILGRANKRDGQWFYLQGSYLLRLKQAQAAHESFRTAVRMEPENKAFRQGALDAALAMRKQETLSGRVGCWAWRVSHRAR